MAILPATGSAITFTNVRKGYGNTTPGAGSNVALRGTLEIGRASCRERVYTSV